MKTKLSIVLILIWINGFGQKLPINGLCWGDVFTATGTTCSQDAWAAANSSYFDPAYAVSGNCLDDWRNYGPPSIVAPTVYATTVSAITGTTATGGGYVSSDGGSTVLSRGVCWATHSNPTLADSYVSGGAGLGSFTAYLTDLSPGTRYYYRAFAQNAYGTGYDGTGYFDTEGGCTRPSGLSTLTVWYTAPDYSDPFSTIWEAYGAKYQFCPNSYGYMSTKSVQFASLSVGQPVYDGTGTDCTSLADGWYFYEGCSVDANDTWYIHIESGVIESMWQGPS